MDWLKLALLIAQFLGSLVSWLRTRELIDAAKAGLIADALTQQAEGVRKAEAARAAVRDAAKRDPASVLRDDDGFKRK